MVLQECLDLGLKYAAVGPAFEGDRTPHGDQIEKYKQITEGARVFKENGIQFQVHCAVYGYLHDYKGRPTYQGMIEEAGIDLIQPEFDTAWMICSGNDPIELLKKYRGHVDILHFKDYHPVPYDTEYILVRHNEVCDHHRGCAVGDNGVLGCGLYRGGGRGVRNQNGYLQSCGMRRTAWRTQGSARKTSRNTCNWKDGPECHPCGSGRKVLNRGPFCTAHKKVSEGRCKIYFLQRPFLKNL